MKKILLTLLVVLSTNCMLNAKNLLGQVTITMNDGTIINGYSEDLMKHERTTIKVSQKPDGKKPEKYNVADIRELRYVAQGDITTEYWYPVPYYHTHTVLMKKVRQSGSVTLWIACIGRQELLGAQGMRWVEHVRNSISFGPNMAEGTAWDLPHIKNGLCKGLPGFKDFVKAYKKSHSEVKDWTELDALMAMCKAYTDSLH